MALDPITKRKLGEMNPSEGRSDLSVMAEFIARAVDDIKGTTFKSRTVNPISTVKVQGLDILKPLSGVSIDNWDKMPVPVIPAFPGQISIDNWPDKVTVGNFPKSFEVSNLKDIKIPKTEIPKYPAFPKQIEVSNLKDIKIPKFEIPKFPAFPKFPDSLNISNWPKRFSIDDEKPIRVEIIAGVPFDRISGGSSSVSGTVSVDNWPADTHVSAPWNDPLYSKISSVRDVGSSIAVGDAIPIAGADVSGNKKNWSVQDFPGAIGAAGQVHAGAYVDTWTPLTNGQVSFIRLDAYGSSRSTLINQSGAVLDATYGGISGLKVHVVATPDIRIKTNIDEGAAIGTDDAIPMAFEDGSGNKLNIQGTTRGSKNALSVEIVDASGAQITSFGSSTVTANQGTAGANSWKVAEDNSASIKTAVEIIDDWDESDRAKVNPIAGQAGVQGGSGTVSNTTQRVVLATDVALPTGTNSIGSVVPRDSSANELTDNKRLVVAPMATSGGSLYNATAYNATIGGYTRTSIEAWNSGLGAFEVMNHREQVWKGTTTAGTNISTTVNTVLRGFAIGGTDGFAGWTGSIYFVNASSGTTAATVTFTNPTTGWHEYPMLFSTALRVVITASSGTPDVTVHYVN